MDETSIRQSCQATQIQDTTMCYLKAIHSKYTHKLQLRGWKMMSHANTLIIRKVKWQEILFITYQLVT